MNTKFRLTLMNFLQFAVWGAYLTSMGGYLAKMGLGSNIGWFYSVQGFVSILMPALMGIVADRWIQAQRLLSICHAIAASAMVGVGVIGLTNGENVGFGQLFPIYTLSIAFYMPTLALSNSVSFNALTLANLDTVKAFPPIRIFGTIGFICTMWTVDLLGFQQGPEQFIVSAVCGFILAGYALTLPSCPTKKVEKNQSFAQALGLDAFSLFKEKRMALFFIFSMLLGCCLQITNGYASPFISSFAELEEFKGAFFVDHANLLISLSQMSETFCILLIPFFMTRFGIKKVMLIAMMAWVFRFGFFIIGTPVMPGIIWLILSMIVYGVAFDFFNVSGALFVDKETSTEMRSSAQGLFMLMTNGLGASIGMLVAQTVVNSYEGDWSTIWTIFASYALVVAVTFLVLFKEDKKKA